MRLIRFLICAVLFATVLPLAPLAAEPFFDAPALSDDELSAERGGFDLPGGVKVDFGVLITTSVDGLPVLHTEYQVSGNDVRMSAQAAQGDGTVTVNEQGIRASAELPQFLVRHEAGRQISSLIVNTADGRTVDSQMVINLRLDNVQPMAIGSAGYRVQSLGVDAALWRATGG